MAKNTDQSVRTARAEGELVDKNKRGAEIAGALGMTQHAADFRDRQANMLRHLEEDAHEENRDR
ncbi:MAG TPA: hypothetical protein VGL02_06690 [Streptomyces sp.]